MAGGRRGNYVYYVSHSVISSLFFGSLDLFPSECKHFNGNGDLKRLGCRKSAGKANKRMDSEWKAKALRIIKSYL